MAEATIPIAKVISEVTLNVRITGMTIAKVRMWIGIRLLTLATLVIGCGLDVSIDE